MKKIYKFMACFVSNRLSKLEDEISTREMVFGLDNDRKLLRMKKHYLFLFRFYEFFMLRLYEEMEVA